MKFTIVEKEPYIYTFEDREYLQLTIEFIGPTEVEVVGPEQSIEQWARRTNSVPLSDEEFQRLVETRTVEYSKAEAINNEILQAYDSAIIEDADRSRLNA